MARTATMRQIEPGTQCGFKHGLLGMHHDRATVRQDSNRVIG